MIDLQDLRANPERYIDAAKKKRSSIDIKEFLTLDEKYRTLKVEIESLRSRQNQFNKELPKLQGEEKSKGLEEMKALSAKIKDLSIQYTEVEIDWTRKQLLIPSPPLDIVPVGKDDSENVEIKKWGEVPSFKFQHLDHIALGKKHDLFDIERAVNIAGARNYFLKGDGARLSHALMSFAMDLLHRKGYIIMNPPHIVLYKAMEGTSYFPGGEEQAYHLDDRDSDCYLIGTAEVPVTAYHYDEILMEEELPKRYAGYSPCYRREAGTYGKDTAGLYRVHQFYKVEQVVLCKNSPEESMKMHAELLGNAEELVQALKLPYRVVDVCTGDMGQGQIYKNDIECWMPSRDGYGETHSCSTFYDFQSRRCKIRYKDKATGKNVYVHTLNNTLAASPRILISILEVYQQEDGSVLIPEVLRPYMGGQIKIG